MRARERIAAIGLLTFAALITFGALLQSRSLKAEQDREAASLDSLSLAVMDSLLHHPNESLCLPRTHSTSSSPVQATTVAFRECLIR